MERKYVIFNVSELGNIDFNEVLETSANTVRRSIDGQWTFVKWEGDTIPASVATLTTATPPMSTPEILEILSGPEWRDTGSFGV